MYLKVFINYLIKIELFSKNNFSFFVVWDMTME